MDRRTFLKITGMGSMGFASGCSSNPEGNLFSLVQAPEDMVTGKSTWYATTCRECPAGCGVLAKNREGRVIKLEGNPLHPVNRGKLCARGQAALQGLYNPDRIKSPLLKTEAGWQSIKPSKAVSILQEHMGRAAAKGAGRIGMVSEVVGDTLLKLFKDVLTEYKSKGPMVYEPFGFESLKFAHSQLFNAPVLPGLRMEGADLLVNFGADFLETWLSPVEYSRKFKAMHAVTNGRKGRYIHISPYQSLTAANADHWYGCRPGSEIAVGLMFILTALTGRQGSDLERSFRNALFKLVRPYTVAKTAELTGIPATELGKLAHNLMTAKRPLVLGSGTTADGVSAAAVDLTTALLNYILDPALSMYDFGQRHRVEMTAPRSAITELLTSAADGGLDVLLLNNVNPLYTLPQGSGAGGVFSQKSLFVVAFSNAMNDTAASADLIIPFQTSLESWDVYESNGSVQSTLQPVVGQMAPVSGLGVGDFFLQLMPKSGSPELDYRSRLIEYFEDRGENPSAGDWVSVFQKGGRFPTDDSKVSGPSADINGKLADTLAELIPQSLKVAPDETLKVYVTPSMRHTDGRGADRSWLSEIPDPITQVAWQSLAWVHPRLMKTNGWSDGDPLFIETAYSRIQVRAYAYSGLYPNAVVVPMGLGHIQYGRYASNRGTNPVSLLGAALEPLSGAPGYVAEVQKITMGQKTSALATTSGSRVQYDRKIALSVPIEAASTPEELGKGLAMNDFPFTLPLPEGYDHQQRDIYPSHEHDTYRWGMVVDLDRCIGCSACVAACYAENNVGVVGETQMIKGREMAWIRIERYEDPDDPSRMIFFPMMCQHCDNAPCEAVCPVYAPHHSKEGLNNQIYNRCIGTRFCAQNCPYKVRRFNWLEWKWPNPLQMQLNPSVTVRTKGVMEKCSFCVQRIKSAHNTAKNEKRAIRDGEVVPACVQTCPTNALYFGNLMDEKSMVRQLISDPRAYQVMGYLNVKPAVIYLKKVIQKI